MQRKRKQRRRDSATWKRFLVTILDQFPNYFAKYSLEEQTYLNEFYTILQEHNVDTITARNRLIELFKKYVKKYEHSEDYIRLQFLWFSCRYFSNANSLLSVEGFYAASFYGYLVHLLRGNSSIAGVFQLIRNTTPLTDLSWEKLQYESLKLHIPLTNEQITILETVYSTIREFGIQALNPNRIRKNLTNLIDSRELMPFLKRIDARWLLQFYSPAFGLTRLFFHFQLNESTQLTEIIDFQNPDNTVLGLSDVYSVREFPNSYFGMLVVPSKDLNQLQAYFKRCEQQTKLNLYELTESTTFCSSTSLAMYRAEKGWGDLNQTEKAKLIRQLRTSRPRKRRVDPLPLYLSPPFNSYWHFSHHPRPDQIINLYSKLKREFSFEELPLKLVPENSPSNLSVYEIDLLKELIQKGVVTINFLPFRLWNEYSIDQYWFKLPRMPLKQISRLLILFPYAELFFTEKNIHIRVCSPSERVQWIQENLEWFVAQIISHHPRKEITFEWYDPEVLQWKTPFILQK